jgi:hypothetical protein
LDLQIFEKNETYEIEKDLNFEDVTEQEYIIDETQQKMIYYKYDNFWKFKNSETIPNKIFEILEYKENNNDDFRLIILKDFVHYANEIRVKIVNAFSIPVERKSDKILTEQMIRSAVSNKLDFLELAEKIKKEEYKDLNIGIYLETTVFEPETNLQLKKHLLLNRKKESNFYENSVNKFPSGNDFSSQNNDLMDIENNEEQDTDQKLKVKGVEKSNNSSYENSATNKRHSERNEIIKSARIESSPSKKNNLEKICQD